MSELRPCPFCGSDDVGMSYSTSMENAYPLNRFIECGDCGTSGPTAATIVTGDADAQARASLAWNERHEAEEIEGRMG